MSKKELAKIRNSTRFKAEVNRHAENVTKHVTNGMIPTQEELLEGIEETFEVTILFINIPWKSKAINPSQTLENVMFWSSYDQ